MPSNFQQAGPATPRRILFVALLAASLVLTSVYAREGEDGPLHAVQGAVSVASAPVQYAGSSVGAATDAAATAAGDITADANTLSELREQNEELRQLLAEADEYRTENERLRALLGMEQDAGVSGVAAKVVGKSLEAWNRTVTINVGADDGISSGMTVMGSSGVVGQVFRVTASTAEVRLLADPNSGAAVMVQSSRANGIVRGSLEGLLYLEDIDEGSIPEVGDVVITSGLGGSYQAGLMVGTVVSVDKSTSNATGTIVVDPNDDVSSLEDVVVVTSSSSAQGASQSGASSSSPAQAQTQAAGSSAN